MTAVEPPIDETKAAAETQRLPAQTGQSTGSELTGNAAGMPTYSSVEIVDAGNSPIGELDSVVHDGTATDRFVENKNAKGLAHPKNRLTADQWASDQILDKTNNRISTLESPQASSRVNPNGKGSAAVPTMDELRSIKAFVFEVEANDPAVISAVNKAVAELTKLHGSKGYTFTASFGNPVP